MPKVNIKITPNHGISDADLQDLLNQINKILAADGFCHLNRIKSFISITDKNFMLGDNQELSFALIEIAILAGRERQIIQDKGQVILALAKSFLNEKAQNEFFASLEFREMDKDFYFY